MLCLTEVERVKALAAQLVKLLRAQKDGRLPVQQLLAEYSKTFGYGLRLHDYDANSLPELLNKLCHVVKVSGTSTRLKSLCRPYNLHGTFCANLQSKADNWTVDVGT